MFLRKESEDPSCPGSGPLCPEWPVCRWVQGDPGLAAWARRGSALGVRGGGAVDRRTQVEGSPDGWQAVVGSLGHGQPSDRAERSLMVRGPGEPVIVLQGSLRKLAWPWLGLVLGLSERVSRQEGYAGRAQQLTSRRVWPGCPESFYGNLMWHCPDLISADFCAFWKPLLSFPSCPVLSSRLTKKTKLR